MTVENISWSISTKECCRPRRWLKLRPPGLQSDGASNWATEAGEGSNPAQGWVQLMSVWHLLMQSLPSSPLHCVWKTNRNYLGHVKICLWRYADRERPDQPVHPRSLISTFPVRCQNHWILQNVYMESKCQDDTLHMHMMLWICTYCTCLKAVFGLAWPVYVGRDVNHQFQLCHFQTNKYSLTQSHKSTSRVERKTGVRWLVFPKPNLLTMKALWRLQHFFL